MIDIFIHLVCDIFIPSILTGLNNFVSQYIFISKSY